MLTVKSRVKSESKNIFTLLGFVISFIFLFTGCADKSDSKNASLGRSNNPNYSFNQPINNGTSITGAVSSASQINSQDWAMIKKQYRVIHCAPGSQYCTQLGTITIAEGSVNGSSELYPSVDMQLAGYPDSNNNIIQQSLSITSWMSAVNLSGSSSQRTYYFDTPALERSSGRIGLRLAITITSNGSNQGVLQDGLSNVSIMDCSFAGANDLTVQNCTNYYQTPFYIIP